MIPKEPVSESAGAKVTIYHNDKYATAQDAWNAVRDQAAKLSNQPQLGGFFDWAINYDADN